MSMEEQRLRLRSDLTWVSAAFLIVAALTAVLQPLNSINAGTGWDGPEYVAVARAFASGERPAAAAPFVYRLGTPFLASILGVDDVVRSFKYANIAGAAAATVALVVALALNGVPRIGRIALAVVFIVQWHGPLRYAYFNPVSPDPWSSAWIFAGLACLALTRRRGPLWPVVTALLCVVGVFFREAVALIGPAWTIGVLARYLLGPRPRPVETLLAFLPPLAAAMALWATHAIATSTAPYQFIATALYWLETKGARSYLHAWFVTYGLVLVLPIFDWRHTAAWLIRHPAESAALAAIAALGWVGGSDTERILYWSAPIVFVLAGLSIDRHWSTFRRPDVLVPLIGLQAIALRLLWTIPDPEHGQRTFTFLTPWGSNTRYLDLFSFQGSPEITRLSLYQYLATSVVLYLILRFRSKPASH